MSEPAEDPKGSRAHMRAYLQRRRSDGPLSTSAFLQTRPEVDDALRAWLQAAESWTEEEIERRLHKLDDESAGLDRTLPIDRAEALDRTMPLRADDAAAGDEPAFDGRYRILRVVGEGGCGKVYLVEDLLQEGEQVALKVVRTDLADQAQFEQRFRNEIRVLRALGHPRIPQIFNDGKTPSGDIYYTMSFVPGASLADILDGEAPLDPARIVRLVRQIIEVLEYAHAKGVVHRDLKPSNILILNAGTADEQVRVLDFGIAKILSRVGVLENAETMQTMAMLGTPHYMSPEQVSGQPIDPATDIYALGVIVYQMCSGKLPFTGGAVMELLTARLRNKPPKLANEEIPGWLRDLVARLLEMEGHKRPSTQQIHAIFERGMQVGSKATRRNMLALGAAGLLALAGAYSMYARTAEQVESGGDSSQTSQVAASLVPAEGALPFESPDESPDAPNETSTDEPDEGATAALSTDASSTDASSTDASSTDASGGETGGEVPDGPPDEATDGTSMESGEALALTTGDAVVDDATEGEQPASSDSSGAAAILPIAIPLPSVNLPGSGGVSLGLGTGTSSPNALSSDGPVRRLDPGTAESGPVLDADIAQPAESRAALESVTFSSPEPNLITNQQTLEVSGTCSPGVQVDLAVGLAEEAQRSVGLSELDGTFARRISLPPTDGEYTLVVESDGRRIGELGLRIDRSGPRIVEVARLLGSGPFAYEDGPIQAQFRFDEPVVLRTVDGVQCDELAWGSGVASFPLPTVNSAEAEEREILLRAVDALGNETEFTITVRVFSAALASLAGSTVDDLDSFVFTTGSAEFPPPIGFDVGGARFLIPDAAGMTRVWALPEGMVLMGRLQAVAPYHVFGIDTGREQTQMVLVSGAESASLNQAPFLIDRREVAWVRYEAFIQASAGAQRSYRDLGADLPGSVVAGVEWRDAEAFARWAKKQLPSAEQWEVAAGWTGDGLQRFPWGAEFLPAAIAERGVGEAIPSNGGEADNSPWGVLGMGAGVREWIADLPSDRTRRVARGGTSYVRVPFGFTLADDYEQAPATYDDSYGVTTAEKTLRLLESSANLKDVGLRCIIALEAH